MEHKNLRVLLIGRRNRASPFCFADRSLIDSSSTKNDSYIEFTDDEICNKCSNGHIYVDAIKWIYNYFAATLKLIVRQAVMRILSE